MGRARLLVKRTSTYQPTSMTLAIGAGLGDGFEVQLDDGLLAYGLHDASTGQAEEGRVPVAADGWRRFRKDLEALEAFSWTGRFEPAEEMLRTDGVSWSIDIGFADGAAVVCEGYDAYPPDGTADELSKPFKRFCRAVSRLLGGLEFGWEVARPPARKGSRLRVSEWIHDRRERLELELCRQVPSLDEYVAEPGSSINWVAPNAAGKEIRDSIWPLVLPPPTPQEDGFWPARGPVWDAAGHVGGRDGLGVVLIEGKAHTAELLSPRMQPSSLRIDEQRRAALDEAKAFYGVGTFIPWTSTYYQLANRLSFLYYLRVRRKHPAWLINIYFCGDSFRSGKHEVVGPVDAASWKNAIGQAKASLGLPVDHPLSEYVADVFLPASPGDA